MMFPRLMHLLTHFRRFLRAQNYDPMKAYKKFEAACLARKSRRISTFFENIGIADFEETRKMVCCPSNNV